MTPRSIRRAQERKAAKLARKAALLSPTAVSTHPEDQSALGSADSRLIPSAIGGSDHPPCHVESLPNAPGKQPVSPAQLAANRANAQLSSGPKSSDGKAKSSLNAVKTALTGRTVLLSSDDAVEYERHLRAYEKQFRPVGAPESVLVQSLADSDWRLQRIPALEMAIYAQGRLQFAKNFEDHDVAVRPGLIELHTFLAYERQLRNLQLQEARLHRRREKDAAELRQLQKERDKREAEELETAAKLYLAAKHDQKPFHPGDYGFEFSTHDVESYLEGVRAANITRATLIRDRDAALDRMKTRSRAA